MGDEKAALLSHEEDHESSGLLGNLPDAELLSVLGFLDGPDLCRAGASCRRLRRLSKDEGLWTKLLSRSPLLHFRGRVRGEGARVAFKRRYKEARLAEVIERELQLESQRAFELQCRVDAISKTMLVVGFNWPCEIACSVLALLAQFLCVAKMDRLLGSWPAVLFPLYLLLFIAFCIAVFALMSIQLGRCTVVRMAVQQAEQHKLGPLFFGGVVKSLLDDSLKRRAAFWAFVSSVWTFLVLLSANATTGSISWPFVIAPLLVSVPAATLFVSTDNFILLCWTAPALTVFTFLVVLLCQLSGPPEYPWHAVFSPLYILDAFVFVFFVMFAVFNKALERGWRPRYRGGALSKLVILSVTASPFIVYAMGFLVLGAVMAQVSLAEFLDGKEDSSMFEMFGRFLGAEVGVTGLQICNCFIQYKFH